MSRSNDGHSTAAPMPAPPLHAPKFHLPTKGFQGTPEEIERQWFEQVYRGRGDTMKQLTLRAVLMGSVLGGVLSLTNIYIGLKAGWGFGVAITACILSYAIWTTLYKLRVVGSQMTILENNCMQSTASAAGYSTGGTLISAFAAYLIINGQPLGLGLTLAWVFFIAVLGVTMAVPMKRQMINIEQLRFPSGIAAAETLNALHSKGDGGMRAAKALGIAGALAMANQFWLDGLRLISHAWERFQLGGFVGTLNEALWGKAWMGRTVMFSWDPIFIAAGAITGMRVCASMFISGTLCWMVFVPLLQSQGVTDATGFKDLVQWTLWGGTACMVSSGILSFGLQWKSALRAFRGLGAMFRRGVKGTDEMDAIEVPSTWFLVGQVASLVALAWLAQASFGMPYWESTLAVVLSFLLALVACRVTGETDTTPIGAMGKVTQLTFGVINPSSPNVNLMAANITAGAAGSSADLLTDLKSGYLLGAHPRRQFLAQFSGIFIGTVVTVFAFTAMVPNAQILGSNQFPAPAAMTWAAVAKAMTGGLKAMEPIKLWSIVVGGALGIVFSVLPIWFPRKAKYMPSAAGVGLAWVFHWYYGLLFFSGAVLGWWFQRRSPKQATEFTFPVASGIIAGGSLMGVILILWENGPEIVRKLIEQIHN